MWNMFTIFLSFSLRCCLVLSLIFIFCVRKTFTMSLMSTFFNQLRFNSCRFSCMFVMIVSVGIYQLFCSGRSFKKSGVKILSSYHLTTFSHIVLLHIVLLQIVIVFIILFILFIFCRRTIYILFFCKLQ